MTEVKKRADVEKGRKRMLMLRHCELTASEMVSTLVTLADPYLHHAFTVKWQKEATDALICQANQHRDILVLEVDYSENYVVQLGHSTQEQVFDNTQISLFMLIAKFKDETSGEQNPYNIIHTETHCCISDDTSNDAYSAREGIKVVVEAIMKKHPNRFRRLFVISDCGPKHFRLRKNFLQIQRLASSTKGERWLPLQLQWFFLGAKHGKGSYDSEGGVYM